MYQPVTIYTRIALNAILDHLKERKPFETSVEDTSSDLENIRRGCFVSIHKKDGTLRGCIGTIEPQEENLVKEINRNAVSAAFGDMRFGPVTADELDELELSVDVLTEPEIIRSFDDLDPQIYGVIVSDGVGSRGVLLPSIPTIDSVEKQIEIVKRKAGLSKIHNQRLTFYRFTSNRYH
jgi:AmmeMemoRadiSam system protein A